MGIRVRNALAVILLALAATGCGAADTFDADADAVAAAATKTAEAGSARVDYELRMDMGSRRVTMGGVGEFSFGDDARGRMTLDFPSFGPGARGGSIELRMLGDEVFMRLPQLVGALPQGKSWLAIDTRKAAKAAGLGSLDFSKLGRQQDPAQMLRLLRASSTSVEEDGEVDVRGVRTTRYTAKLDLEKSIEASATELGLDAKQREELRATTRELKQSSVGEIPVEVYVDDDGLLRRFVVSMETSVGGEDQSMVARTDYFDFGVPIDVKAPPAATVFDYTVHLPGAGG